MDNEKRKYYIANAIDRILAAPCDPSQSRKRSEDIAELLVEREGAAEINLGLIDISSNAEAGAYKETIR